MLRNIIITSSMILVILFSVTLCFVREQNYEFKCTDLKEDNVHRCENSEVVCYSDGVTFSCVNKH